MATVTPSRAAGSIVQMSAAEAIAELVRLKGVGTWTAEYVVLRGLGDISVIPAGDVALQAVIGDAYGYLDRISETTLAASRSRGARTGDGLPFSGGWRARH